MASAPPMMPSHDFFGLTLGASGRWIQPPPDTEPIRNAAVSNRNVSRITHRTSALPSGSLSVAIR